MIRRLRQWLGAGPVFKLPFPLPGTRDAQRVFSWIYDADVWSGQGAGSHAEVVGGYVAFLDAFMASERASRIVDIGCGDWSVAGRMDWTSREYIGIDVVDSLVVSNRARFGRPGITFIAGDACASPELVPACDVILVKDVMQHLPNAHVARLLTLLDRCRFMIATNDFAPVNWDCDVGDTRGLNLQARPFRAQLIADHLLIPTKHTVVIRGKVQPADAL